MSQKQLSELERRALINTAKIQALSKHNSQLTQQANVQAEPIARLDHEFDIKEERNMPSTRSRPQSTPLPQEPRATPFYVLARTAPSLELNFLIQGLQGEPMEFAVNRVDMAFLLEQTLKRRGWKDATVQMGVLDFAEVSMMKVRFENGDGEVGILNDI
ncbi:hypothetical protein HBI56_124920 [Parastagonospora nodorum]|nr:hypothetical protein HBH51_128020 [Parastagonospora nodorum]KAH4057003.1 hypothetical protein HBH49_040300 [Parastagonospora nodorum]KAH4076802.1 hypothetical protein HBH50_010650 [Parastagonospora nodorum]KAH4095718.1 hypothetical protein HBH48_047140 [Parastagonospora nodorum]KAH4118763.1 hypothetical protein HBH47_137460 [Parastagonospora nodorum]